MGQKLLLKLADSHKGYEKNGVNKRTKLKKNYSFFFNKTTKEQMLEKRQQSYASLDEQKSNKFY